MSGDSDNTDGIAETNDEWANDLTASTPDGLGVGDQVEFTKTIDNGDVEAFARATGDTNALHLNDDFASQTRFGKKIVHGVLSTGLVSAALARLPGVVILLSKTTEFESPAEIGADYTARCEVVEELGDHQFRLATTVKDDNEKTITSGEAVVLIDDEPNEQTK